MIRNYSELMKLKTFEERFEYLKLDGIVGEETFGFDRVFNQQFYTSAEWRRIRRDVIIRDEGFDLGVQDHDIAGRIIIHHLNPITIRDIVERSPYLLNPEFLICTSSTTHNAIHYSDDNLLPKPIVNRSQNDTCLWRQ